MFFKEKKKQTNRVGMGPRRSEQLSNRGNPRRFSVGGAAWNWRCYMELGVLSPDRTGSSAERQEIALRFVNHTHPKKHPQMTPSACPFYYRLSDSGQRRRHREGLWAG